MQTHGTSIQDCTLSHESFLDDAELAKNYIASSTMSNEYKRVYMRLISISTLATNGISPEEKIQKMTECIQLLAITQGMCMSSIDKKIQDAIKNSDASQCKSCKAMKHALQVEQEQHDKELLESYMEKFGIKQKADESTYGSNLAQDDSQQPMPWLDVIKQLVLKPYIYVVLCLVTVSPYGVDIIKTIMSFVTK